MSPRSARIVVTVIVAVHMGMALAYTLPEALVPERARFWSQWYMRGLFHQQWRLFAPDPPMCACRVEVAAAAGPWRPLVPIDDHYLLKRMARRVADHVHEEVAGGGGEVMPVLAQALRGLAERRAGDVREPRFRLVERCVEDPEQPGHRSERITVLRLPTP